MTKFEVQQWSALPLYISEVGLCHFLITLDTPQLVITLVAIIYIYIAEVGLCYLLITLDTPQLVITLSPLSFSYYILFYSLRFMKVCLCNLSLVGTYLISYKTNVIYIYVWSKKTLGEVGQACKYYVHLCIYSISSKNGFSTQSR